MDLIFSSFHAIAIELPAERPLSIISMGSGSGANDRVLKALAIQRGVQIERYVLVDQDGTVLPDEKEFECQCKPMETVSIRQDSVIYAANALHCLSWEDAQRELDRWLKSKSLVFISGNVENEFYGKLADHLHQQFNQGTLFKRFELRKVPLMFDVSNKSEVDVRAHIANLPVSGIHRGQQIPEPVQAAILKQYLDSGRKFLTLATEWVMQLKIA